MLDGKKGVAQKVVYGAFDIIKEKTDKDPMEVYTQALENIMPSLRSARLWAAPPTRCPSRSGPSAGRPWVCAG